MSLLNGQAALVLPWQRHSTVQLSTATTARNGGSHAAQTWLSQSQLQPLCSESSFSEAMWLGGKGQDHDSQEEMTTAWAGVQARAGHLHYSLLMLGSNGGSTPAGEGEGEWDPRVSMPCWVLTTEIPQSS